MARALLLLAFLFVAHAEEAGAGTEAIVEDSVAEDLNKEELLSEETEVEEDAGEEDAEEDAEEDDEEDDAQQYVWTVGGSEQAASIEMPELGNTEGGQPVTDAAQQYLKSIGNWDVALTYGVIA